MGCYVSGYVLRSIGNALLPRHRFGAITAQIYCSRKIWNPGARLLPHAVGPHAATNRGASFVPASAPSTVEAYHKQAFDYTAMVGCIAELQRGWVPSRVEEAVQIREHALALRLRTMERQAWLYLSWHPTTAHISLSLVGPPRGALSEAFSYGEIVNASVKGLVFTGASVPEKFERRAELMFSPRVGEAPAFVLLLEFVGRYSNVMLMKYGGPVLAAAHQVGEKQTSARAIRIGQPYAPPPPPPGIPPDSCQSLSEWQNTFLSCGCPGVADSCVRIFRGVSPALAREICNLAAVESSAHPAQLNLDEWDRLYEAWQAWLVRLDTGNLACSYGDGGFLLLGDLVAEAEVGPENQNQSMLAFFHDYYGQLEEIDEFQRLRQRVIKTVAVAKTRITKKIASLQAQASDPSVHEATSRIADLLMANLHIVKPGATFVEVEDWDTGEKININLDSTKTPVACAEALYAKARKQRRAVDQVAPLLQQAASQASYLEEVEVMVQQLEGSLDAADLDALHQIETELVSGGLMKPKAPEVLVQRAASKGKKASKRGKNNGNGKQPDTGGQEDYRRFLSPSGFRVLAGRNSAQNDALTMRIAQPNDVWMHARAVPGAHVVLRVPSGASPSDGDLQFAADIAAFYSKARTNGKVEVTYASPEDIRKPRGAKPGQVLVVKERVMIGRPSASAPAVGETDI